MAINFRCYDCGQINSVSDKLVGKPVKCPECGEINTIPKSSEEGLTKQWSPTQHTEPEQSRPKRSFSEKMGLPIWTLCFFVIAAIFFVGLIVYMFGLRDTWERDNYTRIYQMEDKASKYVQSGNFQEALEIYKEIFGLVGDREIKYEALSRVIENAKLSYKKAQDGYKSQIPSELLTSKKEAERLIKSGKIKEGIKAYAEVLDLALGYEIDGSPLELFVRTIREEKQKAEWMLKRGKQPVFGAEKIAEIAKKQKKKNKNASSPRRLTDPIVLELLASKSLMSAVFKKTNTVAGTAGNEVSVDYMVKYVTKAGATRQAVLSLVAVKDPKGWQYKTIVLDVSEVRTD